MAIAARLTEDPDISVGVIEAGKNRLGDVLVDTPAMFLQMLGNPEYDWMMFTTPQVWHVLCTIDARDNKMTGGKQRQSPPFPAWKIAWRVERH